MNDRYQGDGPQGKTRKSAAKLKPKSDAASSVHLEKRPTNKQERKAARKKRDAQLAAKEKERQRKAEERERKERIAAGEDVPEPKEESMATRIKNIFFVPKDKTANSSKAQGRSGKTGEDTAGEAADTSKNAPAAPAKIATWQRGPDTPEYRKLKRIYWVLMAVGVFFVIVSLVANFAFPDLAGGYGTIIPMAIAYPAVIGALILDNTKIRKMQRAHSVGAQGRQSPKQQKHMQKKAEAAALLEESKKAQKELKRSSSKIPFVKGKSKAEADASNEQAKADTASNEQAKADTGSTNDATGVENINDTNNTEEVNPGTDTDATNERMV
jgi:hypothetical protein